MPGFRNKPEKEEEKTDEEPDNFEIVPDKLEIPSKHGFPFVFKALGANKG